MNSLNPKTQRSSSWRSMMVAAGAMTLICVACGPATRGVVSVNFALVPAVSGEFPAGFDTEQVHDASGSVSAEIGHDEGMVMAVGLPSPPLGYDYMVTLMLAHGTRKALPGSTEVAAEGGGHAHGALSISAQLETDEAGGHDEENELENVAIGMLEPVSGGAAWMIEFAEADLDGHRMGALRAAMVMLMPSMGMGGMGAMDGGMVLSGDVSVAPEGGAEPAVEPGGGHDHGA